MYVDVHLSVCIAFLFSNPSSGSFFKKFTYEQNLGSSSNVGISLVHKLPLESLNLPIFLLFRRPLHRRSWLATVNGEQEEPLTLLSQ